MAMRRILSARVYIGQQPDGTAGNWPALIEPAAFELVQRRLSDSRRMPRQASGRYVLTGLLRCPRCGSRMSGSGRHKSRSYARYECRAQWLGSKAQMPGCRYSVTARRADSALLEEVARVLDMVTDSSASLRSELERARLGLGRTESDDESLIRIHELAATRSRERIKRLALLFVDGDLDRDGYELGRAQAQEDLLAAENALARLRIAPVTSALPPFDEVVRQAGSWRAMLEGGSSVGQRDVRGELVDHVVPEQAGYRRVRVTIVWTRLGDQLREMIGAIDDARRVA